MSQLPYRAITDSGAVLDVNFPLHGQTASPMRVQQLLGALLEALTREIRVLGTTSNGDVLQALAMALAVRAGMVEQAPSAALSLSRELVETAVGAVSRSALLQLPAGHA